MGQVTQSRWVIGTYQGLRAKSVVEHAHAGIGYVLIDESGKGDAKTATVAFRYAEPGALPDHLVEVTNQAQIAAFESRYS